MCTCRSGCGSIHSRYDKAHESGLCVVTPGLPARVSVFDQRGGLIRILKQIVTGCKRIPAMFTDLHFTDNAVPTLIPEPSFDVRYPSERVADRLYRAYALAHGRVAAVYRADSYHAQLDDDARADLYAERLAALHVAETAYRDQVHRCAKNAERRASDRAETRISETAQKHLFVDEWPDEFQYVGSRFPHRPLVANDPTHGSFRRGLYEASQWLRVQHNTVAYAHLLVIDYDAPRGIDVREVWKRAGLPRPTYIVCNHDSPRGHLAYAIKTPIPALDRSKTKALEYFHAIWVAYTKKIGGDLCYTQTLSKNPVHFLGGWDVEWINPTPYTLSELASFAELPKNGRKARREAVEKYSQSGFGRNCGIFMGAAGWAYKEIRDYWHGDYATWQCVVEGQCTNMNSGYREPLGSREVQGIARSIAKWTWTHCTPAGFASEQARRGTKGGARSGVTRLAKAQVRAEQIKELRVQGLNQLAIAEKLGVSTRTIRSLEKMNTEK